MKIENNAVLEFDHFPSLQAHLLEGLHPSVSASGLSPTKQKTASVFIRVGAGGGCKQDLLPPLGPSMGLFLCKSIQAQGGCWTLSSGHFFAKTAPVSGSVSISETCYVACLAKNIHPHTANWVLPQGVVSFQNGPSNLVL